MLRVATSSGLGSNTERRCSLTHPSNTDLRGFLLCLDTRLQLYDRLLVALIPVGLPVH